MKKVLVVHGPNLNLLGTREPELYGHATLPEINRALIRCGHALGLKVRAVQSNSEGQLIDIIQKSSKNTHALIINPGAYTHTSVAIRDALSSLGILKIEVHLTNIYARESFRRRSFISAVVNGTITGFGVESYLLALQAVASELERGKKKKDKDKTRR